MPRISDRDYMRRVLRSSPFKTGETTMAETYPVRHRITIEIDTYLDRAAVNGAAVDMAAATNAARPGMTIVYVATEVVTHKARNILVETDDHLPGV